MYYQTKIKSLIAGGAIDTSGKRLQFIGNNPAQVGDMVWTDGRVIFGHTPIRGTPLMFADEPKIPVLGDDWRGYVKSTGKFRGCDIADDAWIVNNDKYFYHGAEDSAKLLDAEITAEGELITVTDGFYRKNQYVTYTNHLAICWYQFLSKYEIGDRPNNFHYSILSNIKTYNGEEIELGVDEDDEDTDVVFYKDGEKFNQLNLKQFADEAENLALEVKDKIMVKSEENLQAARADIQRKNIPTTQIINFYRQPAPPDDFIASTYARVAMLKIQPNGDWDAVITASSYGYCFPYMTFDGSIFHMSFPDNEDKTFSDDLISCLNLFENIVFEKNTLPFTPNIEKYPKFEGDKKEGGNYTDDYKRYILKKIAYYIPLARFKHKAWFCMPFSAFVILRVHNGEISDTIYSNSGGGTDNFWFRTMSWTETSGAYTSGLYTSDFVIDNDEEENDWEFPLDDEYYFSAEGLKLKTIYDNSDTTVVDIPEEASAALRENFYEAYYVYPFHAIQVKDKNVENIYEEQADSELYVFNSYKNLIAVHYKFVDSKGDEDVWYKYPKKQSYVLLSGWFIKSEGTDESQFEEDLRINFNFTKLKGGKYLISARGGKLIKFDDKGNIETIGDDLKNFRLRELKHISKAKNKE